MTKIKDVVQYLEKIAPPIYQESYDNAGLIVGDANAEVQGVLTCLDSIESVVDEAITKGCNLIVAHHPIVFKGLKRLTGKNYVERTIIKAIQHGIGIYAIHTNLDNVYHHGVNAEIGKRLGLINTRILSPKQVDEFWSVYCGEWEVNKLIRELSDAGALEIQALNRFQSPLSTQKSKIEFRVPSDRVGKVSKVLNANEQEPFQKMASGTSNNEIGSGLIGYLPEALEEQDFLALLKDQMKVSCIKHTALKGNSIQKVALCGGSGGFLLKNAIRQKADVFITSDYKYHEFFDADGKIIIADIGHYESEQFTIPLLKELLCNKFSTFAVYETELRTNPVSYFV